MRAIDERTVNGVYCVIVQEKCRMCGKLTTLEIPETEWLAWTQGDEHIQNALKSVSADDRELLISQTCGPCFDSLFADCDDEDGR